MQTAIRNHGRVAEIQLRGRFDLSEHRAFKASYEIPLTQSEVDELQIDMAGVEYLDSSALGMLLILKERAGARNKRLALVNCAGAVRRILDIANFGKLFAIR
jgi:anti-anti-sigma factor